MSHRIALVSLDCQAGKSVTAPSQRGALGMDRKTSDQAITAILAEIHSRLGDAARIASAALACAQTGSVSEGVQVSMDIEQIIYETGRLQDAASLLNRLAS